MIAPDPRRDWSPWQKARVAALATAALALGYAALLGWLRWWIL